MPRTVGDWMNEMADYQCKADWLVCKLTLQYLEESLDAEAQKWWTWHKTQYDEREFLREFFQRYSNVFAAGTIKWLCVNPSAAAVALMKERLP